jgi:hypothetical protein
MGCCHAPPPPTPSRRLPRTLFEANLDAVYAWSLPFQPRHRRHRVFHLFRVFQIAQPVDVYSFGVLLAFIFTGKDSPRVPPNVEVRVICETACVGSPVCFCAGLLAVPPLVWAPLPNRSSQPRRAGFPCVLCCVLPVLCVACGVACGVAWCVACGVACGVAWCVAWCVASVLCCVLPTAWVGSANGEPVHICQSRPEVDLCPHTRLAAALHRGASFRGHGPQRIPLPSQLYPDRHRGRHLWRSACRSGHRQCVTHRECGTYRQYVAHREFVAHTWHQFGTRGRQWWSRDWPRWYRGCECWCEC